MSDVALEVQRVLTKCSAAQDGYISVDLLAGALTCLNPEINGSFFTNALTHVKGKDGKICIDGFIKWVFADVAIGSSPSVSSEAKLLDGKRISDGVLETVKCKVDDIVASGHNAPHLVVVVVGENPASNTYIKKKEAAAAMCGILSTVIRLDVDVSQAALLAEIERLNTSPDVHGMIVQLPLPPHIDTAKVTGSVALSKDVDGLTPCNIGSLALNGYTPTFCPCTPKGCLRMIKSLEMPLRGKEAVIVGASNIVGVPMMLLLLNEGCTVSICHIDTQDSAAHTRTADILVVAVGKPGLVQKDWVKPGAIVIDVGINFVPDPSKKTGRRMVGDVDFEQVRRIAGYITPVPGGVGPMTVAMLMENTLDAMYGTLSKP